MWLAPLERARQSGYSSRSQFCFPCGKVLIQISIQISIWLEEATTRILSRAFPPTAHVSRLFLTVNPNLFTSATVLLRASGVLGCFKTFYGCLIISLQKYSNFKLQGVMTHILAPCIYKRNLYIQLFLSCSLF